MSDSHSLTDIRAFVSIVEQGSLSKAADALGVSRSRISRQLVALEQSLGVTLLVRTTRTQRLTPQGSAFYQQCSQALFQIDQAVLAAADDVDSMRGSIRVNCVGGPIGEDVIAAIAAEFMADNPEIDLLLEFDSRRVDLIGDGCDVIVRMGPLADASYVARPLAQIPMMTLASPAYLAQASWPDSPDMLAHHQCLTGSVTEWLFIDAQNTSVSVRVGGRWQSKNGRAMVCAATAGLGIIRVPAFYCRQQLAEGALVPVFDDWQNPAVPLHLVFPKDKYQARRIRQFIDTCVEYFEQKNVFQV